MNTQEDKDSAQRLYRWLSIALNETPQNVRELLFEKIKEEFCIYCGIKQPTVGMRCQCWNDD